MRIVPWLFRLDLPADVGVHLAGLLDGEERARAAAFRHDIDRDRFIARRGQLRLLLAAQVGERPKALSFGYSELGKPHLRSGDLRFGTSSAGPLGLCVLARGGEVGCDLARDEEVPLHLAIAQRLFSPAEVLALEAMPPEERRRGFLNAWTRKEAYLKALGTGLHLALDGFTVSLDEQACFLEGVDARWRLASLAVGDGYIAAAAACTTEGALAAEPARTFDPGGA